MFLSLALALVGSSLLYQTQPLSPDTIPTLQLDNYRHNYVSISMPLLTFDELTNSMASYETTPFVFGFSDGYNIYTDVIRLTFEEELTQSGVMFKSAIYYTGSLDVNYEVSYTISIVRADPTDGSFTLYPCNNSYADSYLRIFDGMSPWDYMALYDKDDNVFSRFTIVTDEIFFPISRLSTDSIYVNLYFNYLDPYYINQILYPGYDEDVYSEVYNNGYNQGVAVGYEGGLRDGQHMSYDDGYNQGYTDGYHDGEIAGDNSGYDQGRATGYDEGYQVGFGDGYDNALDQGATASIIFNGIISVGLLPVNVFLRMLNFEVFGINIGAFVSSLLTICVIIIIVRMFLGGKNSE